MKHFVFSSKVITNLQHRVYGMNLVHDFLIVDVNPWEAAQLLGAVYGNEETMVRLLDWVQNEDSAMHRLLISVDGKFGVIALAEELEKPPTGSEVLYIGDVAAPLKQLLSEVRRAISNNPKVANKIRLPERRASIPERIRLVPGGDFQPGTASSGIRVALRDLSTASDDSLVWILVLGENDELGITEDVLSFTQKEVLSRNEKKISTYPIFFSLLDVTYKEIQARNRRMTRTLSSFTHKFPHQPYEARDFKHVDAFQQKIATFARRLSDEKLVELSVGLYNRPQLHGDSMKIVIQEFYNRT